MEVGTLCLPASLTLRSFLFSHSVCGSSSLNRNYATLREFCFIKGFLDLPPSTHTHKHTDTALCSRGNLMLLQANPREFRLLQLRGAIFWGLFPPLLLAQTSWKIFPSDVHKHLSLRALYQTWGTESLPADCFGGKQVVLCCRTTPRRTQTCFCFLANLLAVQSS